MIKRTKIGNKIYIEQTTYYVYQSEYHLQNDTPTLVTSSKKIFEDEKKRTKKFVKEMTPKQKLYLEVYDKVYNYKTKYPSGFIASEIQELLKDYPDIDMKKFDDAMMGNTCALSPDNESIIYHCDVEKALLCGIEKRGLYSYEWD